MEKLTIAFFLVFAFYFKGIAQDSIPINLNKDSMVHLCGFNISDFTRPEYSDVFIKEDKIDSIFKAEFRKVFTKITSFEPTRIDVRSSTSQNTHSWVSLIPGNSQYLPKKEAIFYHPDSIQHLIKRFKVSYELWGVMIHEICHLTRNDSYYENDRVKAELKADFYLGYHARLLFDDPKQATSAIEKLCFVDHPDYPKKQDRIISVLKGWEEGAPEKRRLLSLILFMENIYDGNFNPTNRLKRLNEYRKDEVAGDSWKKVEISKFPNQLFFVNNNNELVFQDKDGLLKIGNISASIRDGYEKMIVDKYFQTWFIDSLGNISTIKNGDNFIIGNIK